MVPLRATTAAPPRKVSPAVLLSGDVKALTVHPVEPLVPSPATGPGKIRAVPQDFL